jgi:hypothetical protein
MRKLAHGRRSGVVGEKDEARVSLLDRKVCLPVATGDVPRPLRHAQEGQEPAAHTAAWARARRSARTGSGMSTSKRWRRRRPRAPSVRQAALRQR